MNIIEKIKNAAIKSKNIKLRFLITISDASNEKNVATIKNMVKYSRHLLEYSAVLIKAVTIKNMIMKFLFFKKNSDGYKRRYKKAKPINKAIET